MATDVSLTCIPRGYLQFFDTTDTNRQKPAQYLWPFCLQIWEWHGSPKQGRSIGPITEDER